MCVCVVCVWMCKRLRNVQFRLRAVHQRIHCVFVLQILRFKITRQ